MSKIRAFVPVAILAIFCAAISQGQEKKIVMTHVKYDGLKQEILKHRGKVVIVDFWASNCLPCREAFPKFIKMHEKYADKGLVVITVSIDPSENQKAVDAANKFLNQVNAPMRNLLLDEPEEVLQKQFDFVSIPFYYLFDRQGKWVRYRSAEFKDGVPYAKVEEVVVQMLNEK